MNVFLSNIINQRLVILLMPVERLGHHQAPEQPNPILDMIDGRKYVLMTHEAATIPVKVLGAEFCDATAYRAIIKGAIDFMLDGI